MRWPSSAGKLDPPRRYRPRAFSSRGAPAPRRGDPSAPPPTPDARAAPPEPATSAPPRGTDPRSRRAPDSTAGGCRRPPRTCGTGSSRARPIPGEAENWTSRAAGPIILSIPAALAIGKVRWADRAFPCALAAHSFEPRNPPTPISGGSLDPDVPAVSGPQLDRWRHSQHGSRIQRSGD